MRFEDTKVEEDVSPGGGQKTGGLVGLQHGGNYFDQIAGKFTGIVGGEGHGMQDNIQMPIVQNGGQVATLAVSPKEYVVDAATMSALGNGNPDAGAKIMDNTIKHIRQQSFGTTKQPREIDGQETLIRGLSS